MSRIGWMEFSLARSLARTHARTHTHTHTLHHESNFWEQLCSCRLTFSIQSIFGPWKALETISNPGDLQHFNYNNILKLIKVGLSLKKKKNCKSKATHLIIYIKRKDTLFQILKLFHVSPNSLLFTENSIIQWLKCSQINKDNKNRGGGT